MRARVNVVRCACVQSNLRSRRTLNVIDPHLSECGRASYTVCGSTAAARSVGSTANAAAANGFGLAYLLRWHAIDRFDTYK